MIDWSLILIRTDRPDAAEMLSHWEWLIGADKHPLVMTKFGDWFLADADGRVHWLDLLEGACNPVAASVEEFQQLMVTEEKLDEWFMLPWCRRLHAEGLVPGEDQCYGFKLPPRLGARVDLSNVEVADLRAYQIWMSGIANIPPGTVVSELIVDPVTSEVRWK